MPIATPEKYAEMLDAAKANAFAFPAINVSSSQTLNAALQGFADAGSDGILGTFVLCHLPEGSCIPCGVSPSRFP